MTENEPNYEDLTPEQIKDTIKLAFEGHKLVEAFGSGDIDEPWLIKQGFGVSKFSDYPVYYKNGLYLVYWLNLKQWRWQIGGTDNMWQLLHTPTHGFISSVLKALGNK